VVERQSGERRAEAEDRRTKSRYRSSGVVLSNGAVDSGPVEQWSNEAKERESDGTMEDKDAG
jgi:hypothetical protein